MAQIHPTAVVDPRAHLEDGVSIGAYSIIKGPVRIGPGTTVYEQTNIWGNTVIGRECQIGPAAFVGLPPQHLRADLESGHCVIGDHVIIRETASVHRATHPGEEHATRIGNHCFIMGGVHVAHDCRLDERVTAANSALLGGHCQVGSGAFLGGGCTLHQFVRVGRLAIIAGNEAASQDIPPFATMRYGGLKAYNARGCQRAELPQPTIHAIRMAYRCLHSHRIVSAALDEIRRTVPDLPEIRELIDFIASSKRGILPSLRAAESTPASRSAPWTTKLPMPRNTSATPAPTSNYPDPTKSLPICVHLISI
jgi:UDP-N-acetylglucosamine acyltransferase